MAAIWRPQPVYPPYQPQSRRTAQGSPPAAAITLSTPVAYQTFQRDATGRADIALSGTYTGSPASIEADFAGRGYTAAVASPSGGTFSSKSPLRTTGSGTLTVRHSDNVAVTATATPVLVGDVWAGYGQSNVTGRGTNNQSYTGTSNYGSKLNSSNAPALMADPAGVDSNGTPTGSFWPLLATLVANAGVPFQAIVRGAGGTSITAFLPDGGNYSTLITAVRLVTTAPRGVIFWQGETDAVNGMSASTYYSNLVTLASGVHGDLGCNLWVVRLQNCTDSGAAAGLAAIQSAQARAFAECPYVTQLCDLSDISTDDGFHLQTDAHLSTAATRMFAGMQAAGHYTTASTGGGFGRGGGMTGGIYG